MSVITIAASIALLPAQVAVAVAAAFTIEASATPDLQYGGRLGGISCPADNQCWAAVLAASMGIEADPDQMAHWDPADGWTLVSSPASAEDVACVSTSDCWAVGRSIQHWDGTSWTLTTSPSDLDLRSVACVHTGRCWAVGTDLDSSVYPFTPVIVHWTGARWIRQDTGSGTLRVYLNDITCASPHSCWAVGYKTKSHDPSAIYDHWDGTSWSFQPTDYDPIELNSVACPKTTTCWAVGEDAFVNQPVISQWDGTAWTAPAHHDLTHGGILNAVACLSPTNCWAGGYAGGPPTGALIEHLTSTGWAVVTVQEPASPIAHILGLACRKLTTTSGTLCKATGYADNSDASAQNTLVETRTTH